MFAHTRSKKQAARPAAALQNMSQGDNFAQVGQMFMNMMMSFAAGNGIAGDASNAGSGLANLQFLGGAGGAGRKQKALPAHDPNHSPDQQKPVGSPGALQALMDKLNTGSAAPAKSPEANVEQEPAKSPQEPAKSPQEEAQHGQAAKQPQEEKPSSSDTVAAENGDASLDDEKMFEAAKRARTAERQKLKRPAAHDAREKTAKQGESKTKEPKTDAPKASAKKKATAPTAKKTTKQKTDHSKTPRPSLMKEGDATVYYLTGKINRNSS